MTPLQGPSRFILETLLGEGGFCTVHRCADQLSGRTVALKMLRTEMRTPENESALKAEYLLHARLKHPNLLEVYDFGIDSQFGPYIVLEYCEGHPFQDLPQHLSAHDCVEAIVQLCRALNFLHSKGLVHGDLKPENVIRLRAEASRPKPDRFVVHVKLIDLGLTVKLPRAVPLPRRGTLSYAAPEVLSGAPADHRADLYSLGALIRNAFPSFFQNCSKPQGYPLRPAQPAQERLIGSIQEIAQQLLQEDPAKRPASVADVIECISRLTGTDLPIETPDGTRAGLRSVGLVGRQAELSEIVAASATLATSSSPQTLMRPSVFLIHGEAGIGKTRLIDEVCEILKTSGTQINRGASPKDGGTAFHPFRSLLHANALCGPLASSVEPFSVQNPLTDQTGSLGWAPYARSLRLASIAETIAAAALNQRSVVVAEDLHLADEETFEVFLRLTARASSGAFLLVASFRTEGLLASRLERLIDSQFNSPHIRSIELRRLSSDETDEFVQQCFGPHRDASALSRLARAVTDGNPLFLIEHLRGMMDSGQIQGGPFRWKIKPSPLGASSAPLTLKELVCRRVAGVSPDETAVLEWLSALGQPASLTLLHEASGRPYAELRHLLLALQSRGLLARLRPGAEDTYSFTHNLYPQALYESLSSVRRAELHRSIGVALERLWGVADDERSARLAFHFLRAADAEKGPRYALVAAAVARRRGATHQAISLYHDCLNLLGSDRMDLRYEVLETLAWLLRQAGDLGRAERFYLEMLLSARRRLDIHREAIAMTFLGRIHADRGDLQQANAFASRALQLHSRAKDPKSEAEALLVMSMAANKAGEYSRSLDLARRAKTLSEAAASWVTRGLAANQAGLALTSLRRCDEALEEFSLWLKTAEESQDPVAHTLGLSNIGWVQLERGYLDSAESCFVECLSRIKDHGLAYPAAATSLNSGEVARLRGSFSASRQRLLEGLGVAERTERSEAVQYAVYALGVLDLEMGTIGEARANLQHALALSDQKGAKAATALTLVGLAEVHVQLGSPAPAEECLQLARDGGVTVGDDTILCASMAGLAELRARATLDEHQRVEQLDRVAATDGTSMGQLRCPGEPPLVSGLLENHVGSRFAADSSAAGIHLADEAYEIAKRTESRQAMVRADLAGTLAYVAAGDHAAALLRAERAMKLCDECGFRPDKARVLLYTGMAHAGAGKAEEARGSLEQSLSIAEEIGLAMVRARARAELMALAEKAGEAVRADELATQAAAILNDMARTLPDADDRHRFLSVGWRKRVLERAEAAERRKRAATNAELFRARPSDPEIPDQAELPDEGAASSPGDATVSPAPPVARDLRSTVTLLLEDALRHIACDRGMVFLIAPDGTSEIVVARGLESESIQDARSYCRSVVDRAAQGEEILAVDTSRDERFSDRRSVSLFHIISIICVPLKIGPRVMGALYLDSRAGGRLLREEDFRSARGVAARMASSIREAWDIERQREEALLKQKALCQTYRLDAIVGESSVMKKAFRVLEAVIASDCNVLVMGESGTGKELAAQAIHFSGRRKMAPFVPLDCGALQDSLVESELFGYRKGAFTGADMDRRGLFEEADGGTLFLDEITNTSTLFQSKLLRVLQSGEFRRVGDTMPRKVDVRIIAATNADLEETIRSGKFREDLYYRLNVVTLRMPPLRERPEDTQALAEQFAKAFCEKEKVPYRGVGASALRRLCEHSWPGNVRELKNTVESALILSRDGAVRREFLPEPLRGGSFEEIRGLLREGTSELKERSAPCADDAVDPTTEPGHSPAGWTTEADQRVAREIDDRARIEDALRRAGGDKSLAAGILGWSRMTLYRKMRRLGIDYGSGRSESPSPS